MIDQEHEVEYSGGQNDYKVYRVRADEIEGCNFDCLVAVPNNLQNDARLVLKCHNTGSPTFNTEQGIEENIKMAEGPIAGTFEYIKDENAILIVPLIIHRPNGEYHQQLTKGALLDKTPGFERVDIQVVNSIKSIAQKLAQEDGILTKDKVDLVGFSAAGSFAQRFMLLHPEMVRAIYAGGAMDGIPLPVGEIRGQQLNYPLGIADYEEITGHKFDLHAFRNITMRFSYGAKEKEQLSTHYFDELGNPVSNFDMSYIRTITPEEDGIIMRKCIGRTPKDRFWRTITAFRGIGIDVEAREYPELGHEESEESIQDVRKFFERVNIKETTPKTGSIFLIGPMGTGKSTTAYELARLMPGFVGRFVDRDIRKAFFNRCKNYSREEERRIREQEGFKGVNRYWKQFEVELIEKISRLDDGYSIVDFGAGQTVYEDEKLRERVQRALGNKNNVFLILPCEDINECQRQLEERISRRSKGGGDEETKAINLQFLKAEDNYMLATHIIYTNEAEPDEVARTIAEIYYGKEITSDKVTVKVNQDRKKDIAVHEEYE